MKRGIALLIVAAVLIGVSGIAVAGPIGTAVAQDDPVATNETSGANETTNGTDISPGERLSGVIGVQRAEFSGEVDSRAFEVALNRTETDEERAALVAERVNRTESRLDEIERRQRELRERRDAGELSQGEFAARMAETGARAETAKRVANRSADVVRGLPESVMADRGLNESRLSALRERASEASGPEVAAIARDVAGNDVGGPLASQGRGPPTDAGPGTGPGAGGGPGNGDSNTTNATRGPANGPGNATGGAGNATSGAGNATSGAGNATSGGGAGDGANSNAGGGAGAGDGADGGGAGAGDNADGGAGDGSDTGNAGGGDGADGGDGASDGDRVGNRSDASAENAVNAFAERLAGPVTSGADFVRQVVGIDG